MSHCLEDQANVPNSPTELLVSDERYQPFPVSFLAFIQSQPYRVLPARCPSCIPQSFTPVSHHTRRGAFKHIFILKNISVGHPRLRLVTSAFVSYKAYGPWLLLPECRASDFFCDCCCCDCCFTNPMCLSDRVGFLPSI